MKTVTLKNGVKKAARHVIEAGANTITRIGVEWGNRFSFKIILSQKTLDRRRNRTADAAACPR